MSRDRLGGDAGARTKRAEAWQSMKRSWTLCSPFTTLHGELDFCHRISVDSAQSVSSSSMSLIPPFSFLFNEKFSLPRLRVFSKAGGVYSLCSFDWLTSLVENVKCRRRLWKVDVHRPVSCVRVSV